MITQQPAAYQQNSSITAVPVQNKTRYLSSGLCNFLGADSCKYTVEPFLYGHLPYPIKFLYSELFVLVSGGYLKPASGYLWQRCEISQLSLKPKQENHEFKTRDTGRFWRKTLTILSTCFFFVNQILKSDILADFIVRVSVTQYQYFTGNSVSLVKGG